MEKKKYDLILIGPRMAGKTALLRTIKGEQPQEHIATQSNGEGKKISMGNWLKRNFGSDTIILDTGSKYNEFERYTEWCQQAKTIVFVFNGCEFLDELKNYNSPGKNTSFCRRICSEIEKDKNANICFVATHQDIFKGNIVGPIQESMENANKEYEYQFPNMSKRYHPFSDMMQGRLFGVNALNTEEVKELFNKITEL